jgi:DivIVA domain-containing protein
VRDIEARRQGPSAQSRAEIRTRVPDREVMAMQDVRFSTAIRGYDRDEVHRYMLKVNTLLAELQITASPEYAIKAAVESVQDERRSVIAEAEQEAEEITRRSRSQADDRIEEAKREAERLRDAAAEEAGGTIAGAETRIRVLQEHVDEMQERRERAVVELVELSRILDELLERNGSNGSESPEPAQASRPS